MNYSRMARSYLRSAVLAGAVSALCAPVMAQDQSDDERVRQGTAGTSGRARSSGIDLMIALPERAGSHFVVFLRQLEEDRNSAVSPIYF
jgi:hypothetical protein